MELLAEPGLAAFGLANLAAAYGTYRGVRSIYRSARGYSKKRQIPKRGFGISRSLRSIDSRVHKIKQNVTCTVDFKNGATASGGNGYALTNTNNNSSNPGLIIRFAPTCAYFNNQNNGAYTATVSSQSDLASVFKECRLDKVVVRLFATTNDSYNTGTTYSATMPTFYICNEFNNGAAVAPTNEKEVGDYSNCRVINQSRAGSSRDGSVFSHALVPKLSDTTGNTSFAAPKAYEWLSTNNDGSTLTHNGFKLFCLDPHLTTGSTRLNATHTFVVTIYSSWRGLR